MMFVGAIPRESVEQAFKVINMDEVEEAYVCCSGSFRFEQAISLKKPNVPIHSNDVSLLTTSLAKFAMHLHNRGEPEAFTFINDLAFLEDAIEEPIDRVAAMAVALKMCHFRGNNPHVWAHKKAYREQARHYVVKAKEKVEPYLRSLNVHSFFCGDFRAHAEKAIADRKHVFAWPPLFKGDYERFYRTIHDNTKWEVAPEYEPFNPPDLPVWIKRLKDTDTPHCVCSDHDLTEHGIPPVAKFWAGRSKVIYLYSHDDSRSSLRHRATTSLPFKYTPIDPAKINKNSVVRVVPVDSKHMNFVKDKYQLPGLVHTEGFMRFLVFVDDMLAGGFVYALMSVTSASNNPEIGRDKTIYLLSDFSTTRSMKVSKLIAMMATGQESTRLLDRKVFQRTKTLITTAFSDKPVSMKYRSIFKLQSRSQGKDGSGKMALNYWSHVRDMTNQQIFQDWWKRYGAQA